MISASVSAAYTVPVPLTGAPIRADNYTLEIWQKVLVPIAGGGASPGIYVVSAISGSTVTLTRCAELDDLVPAGGLSIGVYLGDTQSGGWQWTTAGISRVGDELPACFEADIETYRLPADGADWAFAFLRAQAALDERATIYLRRRQIYDFYQELPIKRTITVHGRGGMYGRSGRLLFHGCAGIHIIFPGNPIVGSGQGAVLRNLSLWYAGSSHENVERNGLTIDATCSAEEIYVFNFPANGINIVADINLHGGANACYFRLVRAYGNGRSGWYFQGGDSNACTLLGCDATLNGRRGIAGDGWGFKDESFLGNYYFGCTASSHPVDCGGYLGASGNQTGLYSGCYSEAILVNGVVSGCDNVQSPNAVIGGNIRNRAGVPQVAGFVGLVGVMGVPDHMVQNKGAGGVERRVGRTNTDEVHHVTAARDPFGYKDMLGPAGPYATCWTKLYQGSPSGCAVAYTHVGDPKGAGHTWHRRGVLLGVGRERVQAGTLANRPTVSAITGAVATEDIWNVGDWYLNSAPASGQPMGWFVSAVDATTHSLTWANGPMIP